LEGSLLKSENHKTTSDGPSAQPMEPIMSVLVHHMHIQKKNTPPSLFPISYYDQILPNTVSSVYVLYSYS